MRIIGTVDGPENAPQVYFLIAKDWRGVELYRNTARYITIMRHRT